MTGRARSPPSGDRRFLSQLALFNAWLTNVLPEETLNSKKRLSKQFLNTLNSENARICINKFLFKIKIGKIYFFQFLDNFFKIMKETIQRRFVSILN